MVFCVIGANELCCSAVAVSFVDLMRSSGVFSAEEAEDYMKMGVLNGLFVLGRSIGLIAHYLDQKRLRTGLYRFVFFASHSIFRIV